MPTTRSIRRKREERKRKRGGGATDHALSEPALQRPQRVQIVAGEPVAIVCGGAQEQKAQTRQGGGGVSKEIAMHSNLRGATDERAGEEESFYRNRRRRRCRCRARRARRRGRARGRAAAPAWRPSSSSSSSPPEEEEEEEREKLRACCDGEAMDARTLRLARRIWKKPRKKTTPAEAGEPETGGAEPSRSEPEPTRLGNGISECWAKGGGPLGSGTEDVTRPPRFFLQFYSIGF